ncbi:prephenate dehydrogenase [Priestia megaterium]|uniref:Prephenate dehydrogenase n=1 Tax=Priestia megaterium (strain ATCC 14581 / DSM 32 / CCUG 1817 / JCM 2506 / NBRC 15308 / NCIMB 9376 / NCTC 10342 / NRRL B-14308 / VKM B-512 / Ford 19) TaxID=1348623 RepID=A0A0B6A828_PRIM2|nr:prephenate dehydrogenase [Priestia megaterium]AJI21075.1 prephenate dehydrogenase family protein [Priestia megaterium NBRC 15308 = ATCC 14581]KFN05012.1 prephenate dehydrogenase family protein [Priestia megaterium]KGJ84478.1 prephenate dehydrogenase [Priestia megaterium NBRC 15308 = ATCC 14581]MDR4231681.1 prephenate dehydrogenase [Priestia megaterium]MED3806427.1 prephenate dehydrogenase [Priestia megaterium]
MKTRVLLIGVGLIGGSLALAMKKHRHVTVVGADINTNEVQVANQLGIVDYVAEDIKTEAAQADYIVLATPVEYTTAWIHDLSTWKLKETVIVTDVGSTKGEIMKAAEALNKKRISFIGGHPMAGSHTSGAVNARADLFCSARYILTPFENEQKEKIDALMHLLEPTGAQFVLLDAATHDQITGVVSHLPHVIATSLVRQVKGYSAQNHLVTEMAAGGFRDITRIASSNPHMWRDILKQNRSMLLTLLDDWMKEMEQVKLLVEKGDGHELFDYFSDAKEFRDSLHA